MTTRAASLPALLKPGETAEALGLTVKGLYQLVQDRRIPFIRLGGPRGRLRFSAEDVRQWLEESRVPSREERP